MSEAIYKRGDEVVIVIKITHVEAQLVDGYPTGEWIAITNQHWRIPQSILQRMEIDTDRWIADQLERMKGNN